MACASCRRGACVQGLRSRGRGSRPLGRNVIRCDDDHVMRTESDALDHRWRTPTGDPCPRTQHLDGTVDGTGECMCCGFCLLAGLVELPSADA